MCFLYTQSFFNEHYLLILFCSTASPCNLPVNLIKLVNIKQNWSICLSPDGEYLAVLQETAVEVRSRRDKYVTLTLAFGSFISKIWDFSVETELLGNCLRQLNVQNFESFAGKLSKFVVLWDRIARGGYFLLCWKYFYT